MSTPGSVHSTGRRRTGHRPTSAVIPDTSFLPPSPSKGQRFLLIRYKSSFTPCSPEKALTVNNTYEQISMKQLKLQYISSVSRGLWITHTHTHTHAEVYTVCNHNALSQHTDTHFVKWLMLFWVSRDAPVVQHSRLGEMISEPGNHSFNYIFRSLSLSPFPLFPLSVTLPSFPPFKSVSSWLQFMARRLSLCHPPYGFLSPPSLFLSLWSNGNRVLDSAFFSISFSFVHPDSLSLSLCPPTWFTSSSAPSLIQALLKSHFV